MYYVYVAAGVLSYHTYQGWKSALRPKWFVHENVKRFPKHFLTDALGGIYSLQETMISPQRFGKPMNRCFAFAKNWVGSE